MYCLSVDSVYFYVDKRYIVCPLIVCKGQRKDNILVCGHCLMLSREKND